jgi:cytochrome P450
MGLAGVFSAEGAAWRSQRRLAMEALSQRNLKGFYATLHLVTRRLRARWERKAAAGAIVDVAEEFKRFTVDVTTALVFGHDVNTIEQDDDLIQQKLGLVFPALNRASSPCSRHGDGFGYRATSSIAHWPSCASGSTRIGGRARD